MFYAGNAKYLVAFNERNARDKFVDDHPYYYSEYAKDIRRYRYIPTLDQSNESNL